MLTCTSIFMACMVDIFVQILKFYCFYPLNIVVYSHAGDNDVAHQIIYTGFINELVNVLELPSEHLIVSVLKLLSLSC